MTQVFIERTGDEGGLQSGSAAAPRGAGKWYGTLRAKTFTISLYKGYGMRLRWDMVNGLAVAALLASIGTAAPANSQEYWQPAGNPTTEDYVRETLPPGFRVEATELEGPVFADSDGPTLYKWQLHGLRNGDLGDRKDGVSTCNDHLFTENSGLMSPYPGGFELPELDTRPTCTAVWPPVLAAEDSEPVGKWTITERENGSKQWAYDGFPLYTSVLDSEPGDTFGGTKREAAGDGPAVRTPMGPRAARSADVCSGCRCNWPHARGPRGICRLYLG